jgi:hypothetical protein
MRQLTISDGRASLRVGELCLGTMYFGYRTDEATAFAILDRFLEAGAPSWTQRTTTGSGTARPERASGSSDAGCGPAASSAR